VATFGLDRKQASLQELRKVIARGLRRHPCGIRKRVGGLGASVAERRQNRGARWVAD
jgi:hypothetical protein